MILRFYAMTMQMLLIYTARVFTIQFKVKTMKLKLSILIVGILLFISSCGGSSDPNPSTNNKAQSTPTPAPTQKEDLTEAKNIFTETCSICHKENGEGGTVQVGKKTIKDIPSFKSDKAKNLTDEKLINYITNGNGDMPAFKDELSAEQIKSLVKFIRKEFQGK